MTDTYRIKKSEYASNNPDTYIDIELGGINDTATDLSLVGRTREYGEHYNENVLRLLENFASPEVDDTVNETVFHAIPAVLLNPIDGQTWFNTTREINYTYFRGRWYPQAYTGDVASNWGTIADGTPLPLPVGSQGQTFTYSECVWNVSPTYIPEPFVSMNCSVNPSDGVVTVNYNDGSNVVPAEAFYQIVAIRANDYFGGNDDESFRVSINEYLIREQVPPISSFPRTIETADLAVVTATDPGVGNTLRYTWQRVSPSADIGFPIGYVIESVSEDDTSPSTAFRITVSSPGVFVSTQRIVRGATFVCRVDVLDGSSSIIDTKLSLPVRVEFYNY